MYSTFAVHTLDRYNLIAIAIYVLQQTRKHLKPVVPDPSLSLMIT